MGLIHIEMFATLDLVGQAPGGSGGGPDRIPVRRLAGTSDGRRRAAERVFDGLCAGSWWSGRRESNHDTP